MRSLANCLRALEIALGVLAIFGWLALTAWVRHFTAPDEGRYVGVALEMMRTGDWLVPRLDGMPFFHKPPLFYWLSASAMTVFGSSEWAARLPSMLGATAAATSLWLFLQRWEGAAVALMAVLAFVTMPFLYIGAQFANLDMLVAGWMTVTLLLAAHAALARESGASWRVPLALAFAASALGVLAKGLIGVLLPAIVFVGWAVVARKPRRLRLFLWWPGWLILLGLALPWFVAMQLRFAEFFDYFVITQHFRRFAGSAFNNVQPFWFYLPVLVLLTLPWVGWLAVGPRKQWQARLSDIDWLMLVWLVVIVAFFSLPRSKLIGYVLPALPPVAYFVARALQMRPSGPASQKRLRWTAGVAASICVLAVAAAEHFATPPGARLRLPIGAEVSHDDQILMLDAYMYEIPFYWHLRRPVMVLSDWDAPGIAQRDNWRKEMSDAAHFDPDKGRAVLIRPAAVKSSLCVTHATWVIGPHSAAQSWPWLADPRFVLMAQNKELAAWRFPGAIHDGPNCLGGNTLPHPELQLQRGEPSRTIASASSLEQSQSPCVGCLVDGRDVNPGSLGDVAHNAHDKKVGPKPRTHL